MATERAGGVVTPGEGRPLVRWALQGELAVLTLDNAPVNALSNGLRQALQAAFRKALNDPAVSAVVLAGDHRCFSAGADIQFARKKR